MSKHVKPVAPSFVNSNDLPTFAIPNQTRIANLAYALWLERGCPIGSSEEDWYRAEAMLRGERQETEQVLAASV